MNILEERILNDGRCLEGGTLKVDNFINHQMDPKLMEFIALELKRRFEGVSINKILTVEASGIAPAIMLGYFMCLPVVFAKKSKPSTMDNVLSTTVYSFTKKVECSICVSKEYLGKDDRVLFVDDFLAQGNTALGVIDLIHHAGAQLLGMGFIIEKAFQKGGDLLRSKGIRVESLAIIESLDNCTIQLKDGLL